MSEVIERYLSNRFQWAAPGDQQEDAWLVRFCDKDCGDAIFTGPDAEREAWEYWNRYAPSYNLYVFRLARLKPEETQEQFEAKYKAWLAEGGDQKILTAMTRAKATSDQFTHSTRVRTDTLYEPFA